MRLEKKLLRALIALNSGVLNLSHKDTIIQAIPRTTISIM